MNQKEKQLQQRQQIREFDTELFSYTGQIAWFIPSIFSFIAFILASIPIQEIEKEDRIFLLFSFLLMIWLSYFVLLPYLHTTDAFTPQKKQNRTYDKLKYLPVSKKQYNIVRMEHLFHYIWKFAVIALILQCIFSLLIVKNIGLLNILYIIGMFFLLPLLIGFMQVWVDNAPLIWVILTYAELIILFII